MELLRRVPEEEVAATFVRAELAGRFREEILAGTRGWRIGGLFLGFPDEFEWWRASLSPEEVLDVLYINWDWWLDVSGGSRRPRDAARRIRSGDVAGVTAEELEPLAAALQAQVGPPELIAATTPAHAPLVLVEGHVRLTTYALFPEYLPPELEILVAVSDEMERWSEF